MIRGDICMDDIIKNAAIPLYVQLKNKIKKDIRVCIYKPGDQIPSETTMQEKYQVSRITIRNAIKELQSEGYIQKVHGKGSYVSESDLNRLPAGVTSLSDDAKMQGKIAQAIVFDTYYEKISGALDKQFFDPMQEEIIVIQRLRKIDEIPLMIEEVHFPKKYKDILYADLNRSLYDILLEMYHVVPSNKGRRSARIIYASIEQAKILNIAPDTPVIESEMGVFDERGEPIHTLREIVRGDNDKFFKWYF